MTDAPGRPRPDALRRWAPAVAWTLLLIVITSWPRPNVPNVRGGDKVVHALLYGVLAFLVVRALGTPTVGGGRILRVAALVAALSTFGWVDEWHQQFIPGRSRSADDWAADTLGAALGVAIGLARRPRVLA